MVRDDNMSIYTKTGDSGTTRLMKIQNVAKSDDRIQLLGTIDELTSNLGLVKTMESRQTMIDELEHIQRNLMTIMAGVADQFNLEHKLPEEEVSHLEKEINRMENSFPRKKEFVLPGENELSARYDVARTVARRAERCLTVVDRKFDADTGAKKYMNRLADYLYMAARYTDYQTAQGEMIISQGRKEGSKDTSVKSSQMPNQEYLVNAVLNKLGLGFSKLDLQTAKKLIEKIEEESLKRGMNAVIAVCNPEGNPVAVHVMDGAFLASFDIAMKKAYTSVAVKMSTEELGRLAMPGETFYGIDKADNGRMIIFGGGVPLLSGDRIIGGLGISGGTSEQDSSLADYGLEVLNEVLEEVKEKNN